MYIKANHQTKFSVTYTTTSLLQLEYKLTVFAFLWVPYKVIQNHSRNRQLCPIRQNTCGCLPTVNNYSLLSNGRIPYTATTSINTIHTGNVSKDTKSSTLIGLKQK